MIAIATYMVTDKTSGAPRGIFSVSMGPPELKPGPRGDYWCEVGFEGALQTGTYRIEGAGPFSAIGIAAHFIEEFIAAKSSKNDLVFTLIRGDDREAHP